MIQRNALPARQDYRYLYNFAFDRNKENKKIYKYTFKNKLCSYNEYCLYEVIFSNKMRVKRVKVQIKQQEEPEEDEKVEIDFENDEFKSEFRDLVKTYRDNSEKEQ